MREPSVLDDGMILVLVLLSK